MMMKRIKSATIYTALTLGMLIGTGLPAEAAWGGYEVMIKAKMSDHHKNKKNYDESSPTKCIDFDCGWNGSVDETDSGLHKWWLTDVNDVAPCQKIYFTCRISGASNIIANYGLNRITREEMYTKLEKAFDEDSDIKSIKKEWDVERLSWNEKYYECYFRHAPDDVVRCVAYPKDMNFGYYIR